MAGGSRPNAGRKPPPAGARPRVITCTDEERNRIATLLKQWRAPKPANTYRALATEYLVAGGAVGLQVESVLMEVEKHYLISLDTPLDGNKSSVIALLIAVRMCAQSSSSLGPTAWEAPYDPITEYPHGQQTEESK